MSAFRKILSIEYNVLNLPNKISFEGDNHIINVYAADGRKLSSYYVSQVTQSVPAGADLQSVPRIKY